MSVKDPRTIVAAKRDGKALSEAEIRAFVDGFTQGDVSDALAAAFLMACLLRGLDARETLALTTAMVESGDTISFSGLGRTAVDKHSTGGLGHTGGTLDKLESIPGLRTDLSPEEIRRQVEEVGCAVAAQSPNLVPADGALAVEVP